MDPQTTIELGTDVEGHVAEAFRLAADLAGGEGVGAGDLLRAAVAVARGGGKSQAFSLLASMLSGLEPAIPSLQKRAGAGYFPQVRLSPALAEFYPIAETFFAAAGRVWGRDVVTFALLADTDPSLNGVAGQAGVAVDGLQDDWYKFVTSSDRGRRDPEEWVDWWRMAGVPLPGERLKATGATYLFVWRPDRVPESQIEGLADTVAADGEVEMAWPAGSRRTIAEGQRVFLLRQDDRAPGLVGSGVIAGGVAADPPWPVPVRWDALSARPLVTAAELVGRMGEERLWRTGVGGVKLRPETAAAIEEVWVQVAEGAPVAEGAGVTEALRYAQTLSDLDHKNDWIGVRADVEALSTLVAVNRVEPPLSIAIFGDWGSGKTFLMRRIQERVALLEGIGARQAAETPAGETRTRYCSSILQIEFNAWHFTESNLWASLVNHIFEKLHQKLTPGAEGRQRDEMVEAFFAAFEIARAAREEIGRQVEMIEAEVKQARKAVETEEQVVKTAGGELAKALGRSVWDDLDRALAEEGGEEARHLGQALGHFGFEESLTSAQAVYDTVQRFRSVSGRAREVLGSLLATQRGVYGAVVVALVVLLATVAAAVYQVPVLSIGAALAGGLGWLAERAESARKPLDAIQSFDDWFSQLKQRAESRIATEVAEAQATFEQRKEALFLARQQLTEAQTREAHAKADLKQLTVRDKMRRFVDQRVTAQAYAKHLGIISMIRQDFEDLSDFMYRDRQAGESRLVERVSEEIGEAIPTVERIILYIDDLDRCQPERVVEVLEAIHLLLAFRLFIVVVAVDPRWVIESLSRCYPHLAHRRGAGDGATVPQAGPGTGLNPQATAHDYLEKIFHLPFWVKPMGPEACRSLIAGYLGLSESSAEERAEHGPSSLAGETFDSLVPELSAQQSAIPDLFPAETVGTGPGDEVDRGYSEQTRRRQVSERAVAQRQIEDIEITEREQVFIRDLARYLGNSPRRIKRYANTYRLLKSGLTRQEAGLFAAGEGAGDGYKIVLVFLAVVTGAPSLAPRIFAQAFSLRSSFSVPALIGAVGLEGESAYPLEAANARGALEMLSELEVTAREIETWVPRVMRYAFRLTPVNLASPAG